MSETDAKRERMLDRVRKLMKVATNSAATEAEIESYMAAARKLMDEHNIDEADLIEKEPKTSFDSIVDDVALHKKQIFRHEMSIAQAVCHICDVQMYMDGVKAVHFYGLPTDVSIAKCFYAELLTSIKIMARAKMGPTWGLDHFNYCEGFSNRVRERAKELAKTSQRPGLILLKTDMLRRWADEKLDLRPMDTGGSRGAVSAAYGAGWHDGGLFDLGTDNRIGSAKLGGKP